MSLLLPERLVGAERPRVRSVPSGTVSSAGGECVDLAAKAGLHLDRWQCYALEDSLGERADGRYSAFEVAWIIARQNGKGSGIEARELFGLFLANEEMQVHSAHEFKTAAEGFRRVLSLIENAPFLDSRVAKVTRSHGDEGIELLPRPTVITGADGRQITRGVAPRLRFFARTGGSGRGFSGDVVYLDEAYNVPDMAIAALMPIMATKHNPQLWYLSSAVDQQNPSHASGHVLARIRRRGLAGDDPSLVYLEFSPDEDEYRDGKGVVDLARLTADPAAWVQANPGLGIRISTEHVERERRSMSPRTFAVERLSVGDWPSEDDTAERVIPHAVWSAAADAASQVLDPVFVAVDMTPARSSAAIAIAGRRADGLGHIEVTHHRPGTGWVLASLVAMLEKWGRTRPVIDTKGPAASLIPALEERGYEVIKVSAGEMAQACGDFYDAVMAKDDDERPVPTLRHLDQQPLNDAVENVKKRPLGDAFAWDRKDPDSDISPLVAATLARFGHATNVTEPAEPFVFFD